MSTNDLLYFGSGNVVDIGFIYDYGHHLGNLADMLEEITEEIIILCNQGHSTSRRTQLLRMDLERGKRIHRALSTWHDRREKRLLKRQ